MFEETKHVLYGKNTDCPKCEGIAVWVFNGDMVGNYHYCRSCKIEVGPFAKTSPQIAKQKIEFKAGDIVRYVKAHPAIGAMLKLLNEYEIRYLLHYDGLGIEASGHLILVNHAQFEGCFEKVDPTLNASFIQNVFKSWYGPLTPLQQAEQIDLDFMKNHPV